MYIMFINESHAFELRIETKFEVCDPSSFFFNATYVVTRKARVDYKPVNDGYRSKGPTRYDKSRDKKELRGSRTSIRAPSGGYLQSVLLSLRASNTMAQSKQREIALMIITWRC